VTGRSQPLFFWPGLVALAVSAIALGGGRDRHQPGCSIASHFHQVELKTRPWQALSLVVRLRHGRAPAGALVFHRPGPWRSSGPPVAGGRWPLTALLGLHRPCRQGLTFDPAAWRPTHASPERASSGSKFLALKFQAFSTGWAWPVGWLVGPWLGAVNTSWFQGPMKADTAIEAAVAARSRFSACPGP